MEKEKMIEALKLVSEYCKNSDCAFCLFCDPLDEPCKFKDVTGSDPADWDLQENE